MGENKQERRPADVRTRRVDTFAYVSMLRQLVEEGREVSMLIAGSSMSPLLVHRRDTVCFKTPDRDLHRGDIVFYQRESGQYVCHRICRVRPEGYYMAGDNQTELEGPLRREQIFGLITKINRKGKWIGPGDLQWDFFEKVWPRIIPLRRPLTCLYAWLRRIGRKKK